jgi:hypothetical protein
VDVGVGPSDKSAEVSCFWLALARRREVTVQASVGALVHGPHTRSRMAVPESHEHPDELAPLVTCELRDHAKRPPGRWARSKRQVDLHAAGEIRAVDALGVARVRVSERETVSLEKPACALGYLERETGEPSDRLLPDVLVKPDRQATTTGLTRHRSAFVVRRAQLTQQTGELLGVGRCRPQPRMHRTPRLGRRDLQQLRGETVDAVSDPFDLLLAQDADRRHRSLDGLKLALKSAY